MDSLEQRRWLRELAAQGVDVARGGGTRWQQAVTWGAAAAAVAVLAHVAPANPSLWWVLPATMLIADLLSGVVHWLFDTRIQPGRGWLGRAAVNFLDHHVHPGRSARTGFAATSWRVALVVTLPLLALALLLPPGAAQAWAYWIAVLSLVVPQAHKEAHKIHAALPIRWLQRCRLLLPPAAHRVHHRDHRRAYCVFTGWWNPLLDHAGLWRWLDRLLSQAAVERGPRTGAR